jgi:hypothetical protein
MRSFLFMLAMFAGVGSVRGSYDFSFTTLDHPLATTGTFPLAVDGNVMVGFYRDATGISASHGFRYDGSNFTSLDHPLGAGQTVPYGVRGNIVVGAYSASGGHGFRFDGSNWLTLDAPMQRTLARGVWGEKVVGFGTSLVNSTYVNRGFVFDGSTYTMLDHPQAVGQTYPRDIQGDRIVGYYGGGVSHGFVFDGATFTTLDHPAAVGQGTLALAISGERIVGYYYDSTGLTRGFVYDGASWTTVNHPLGSYGTHVWGASEYKVVGAYSTEPNKWHGFVATIPEPAGASFMMALIAAMSMQRRMRTRR